MKLIDVTLRDGGHTCNFEWPESLVKRVLTAQAEEIDFIEVGYWMQSGKFSGRHYGIGPDLMSELGAISPKPLAVMMDYHYRAVEPESFALEESPISLLRLTARQEDLLAAAGFLARVQESAPFQVSLNLSNISNYSRDELLSASDILAGYQFDFVYFADTHGHLDLSSSDNRFALAASTLRDSGKDVGFHLHNHRGYALLNHLLAIEWEFSYSDVSLGGLGKGGGNLKTEQVLQGRSLAEMLAIKGDFSQNFVVQSNPFFVLTGLHSVVDHYAEQLSLHAVRVASAFEFLSELPADSRDVFNPDLLPRFLRSKRESS